MSFISGAIKKREINSQFEQLSATESSAARKDFNKSFRTLIQTTLAKAGSNEELQEHVANQAMKHLTNRVNQKVSIDSERLHSGHAQIGELPPLGDPEISDAVLSKYRAFTPPTNYKSPLLLKRLLKEVREAGTLFPEGLKERFTSLEERASTEVGVLCEQNRKLTKLFKQHVRRKAAIEYAPQRVEIAALQAGAHAIDLKIAQQLQQQNINSTLLEKRAMKVFKIRDQVFRKLSNPQFCAQQKQLERAFPGNGELPTTAQAQQELLTALNFRRATEVFIALRDALQSNRYDLIPDDEELSRLKMSNFPLGNIKGSMEAPFCKLLLENATPAELHEKLKEIKRLHACLPEAFPQNWRQIEARLSPNTPAPQQLPAAAAVARAPQRQEEVEEVLNLRDFIGNEPAPLLVVHMPQRQEEAEEVHNLEDFIRNEPAPLPVVSQKSWSKRFSEFISALLKRFTSCFVSSSARRIAPESK